MNFASAYQFLPYNLKVIENLRVFAEIYCVDDAEHRIEELLELFELNHLRKIRPECFPQANKQGLIFAKHS